MAQCIHLKRKSACSLCKPELVYQMYLRSAKKRGLSFTLTLGQFERIVNEPCVYCGAKPAGGCDRRDNRCGYVYSDNPLYNNVQAACGPCNLLKQARTHHGFLNLVMRIARYQESQKLQKQNRSGNGTNVQEVR
jgi:hypothetical protein